MYHKQLDELVWVALSSPDQKDDLNKLLSLGTESGLGPAEIVAEEIVSFPIIFVIRVDFGKEKEWVRFLRGRRLGHAYWFPAKNPLTERKKRQLFRS